MKILMVNTRHFYGGGDSVYCFNLAALLRSRGHEVAFFAMQDSRNLPDANADLFVSHIDFRELNRQKNLATGLQVLSRSVYSREARRKFRQMLDRFEPDVVHLHNIHAHITPSIILEARRRRLPVVWMLHDYKIICPNSHFLIDATGEVCEACGPGHYLPAIWKKCKKGSYSASAMVALEAYGHRLLGFHQQVSRFLTGSLFLRQKFIENGFSPSQIVYFPVFMEEEMFDTKDADEGYLLFLGRIEYIKGIYPLLQAARLVPDLQVLLAGGVNESMAGTLKSLLPPNARYLGLKDRKEVKRLLSGARALILPSIWYEVNPGVIIEAFAAGKPVIASDLGSMPELVAGGQRGLLVPPGDVEALAAAMRWMAENSRQARAMGQSAHQHAREVYNANNHYEKLHQIYTEVTS